MDRLVRNMHQLAEVPMHEAVHMASTTPARIMNIDQYTGSLETGKDADLVIFDDDVHVSHTIVQGVSVFKK
jgi:N-acetylglucosamine-6-phosphate deacetylase